MAFLDSIKEKFSKKDDKAIYLKGFKKTSSSMNERLDGLEYKYNGINDEFLEQLTIVLLEADVGIQTADKICEELRALAKKYTYLTFRDAKQFLLQIMHDIYDETDDPEIKFIDNQVNVVLLVGVNGSGKTTSCAKLAKMYKDEGKKVAVVAADTFRAGAIDQLAAWAEKLDIPCIKGNEGADPSSVLVDGCRYAKENNIDILLCDTAGRLQNKVNLMNELSKMTKVVGKEIEGAPHHTWLALDATTGQNGLSQAEIFKEATNITGIILTKMDGTAKGGIIIAIKDILKVPVYFIGLGEHEDDLRPFDLDGFLFSISSEVKNAK